MPIREGEKKFCSHFLGESQEEAEEILSMFDKDLTMLSARVATLTGLDKADLRQEAVIGLARARRDFVEGRGAAFRTLVLYKIKDALREFVTKAIGMRVPQYLLDASKLIENLRRTIEKGTQLSEFSSYIDIWNAAKTYAGDEAILADVNKICDSIHNLAERSHTTPVELLERAEMAPAPVDVTSTSNDDITEELLDDQEVRMVEKLYAKAAVNRLRNILTPAEYDLICAKFLEGKTERDLEKELGIKAPSIDVRLKNILAKIEHSRERIFGDTNEEYAKAEIERIVGEAGAD